MSDRRITLFDPGLGALESTAVREVIESNWLTAGPVTRALEDAFTDRLGVPVLAVNSGTAALHLALLVHGIGVGDEVITPSLTFVACPAMIVACGGTPVFADITGGDDLCVDPFDVEQRLTARTKAVVVMHYGGFAARIADLRALCEKNGLLLIEDAAHAPLVSNPAGVLGTLGAAGCFSLHVTKNIAAGEGGLLLIRDPAKREMARLLRSHAITSDASERATSGVLDYDVRGIGYNYRLTEVASAIALAQLAREDDRRATRRRAATLYGEHLREVDGLQIPFVSRDDDSAHHLYTVLLPTKARRPQAAQHMRDADIEVGFHYPPAHLTTYYSRNYGTRPGLLPKTEDAAARLLSLPIHGSLSAVDVERVCGRLREALGR